MRRLDRRRADPASRAATPRALSLATTVLTTSLSLLLLSLSAAANATPTTAASRLSSPPLVELRGNKILPTAELLRTIKRLPGPMNHAAAGRALEIILGHYAARGYTRARGWIITLSPKQNSPRYRIVIDEGYLHRITFIGANTLQVLMLRVEVYLPHRIFHAPTVKATLKRVQERYHLKTAYARVHEIGPPIRAPDGSRADRRELRIYFLSHAFEGWGLGITLSSTYGVLPRVSYTDNDAFFDTDRLSANLGISFPYRQYLFSESPEFSWVHGFAQGRYRFPRLAHGLLAPVIAGDYAISRLQRQDLTPALGRYLINRGGLMAELEISLSKILSLNLGLGWVNTTLWDIQTPLATPSDAYRTQSIDALVGSLRSRLLLDAGSLRRDLRTELSAEIRTEIARDRWLVKGEIRGQYARCLGYHCIILQTHGTMATGQVDYWNQRPLADFSPVFFDNRFWVQEALSASFAARMAIWGEHAQLGVFYNLAIFGDRRDPTTTPVAFATSFGPSVHLLLLDTFALDVSYGFGFAPGGFDHNLSFNLERVF